MLVEVNLEVEGVQPTVLLSQTTSWDAGDVVVVEVEVDIVVVEAGLQVDF